MKNICGQYISNVKSFFPILGKRERQYIKSLKMDIDDYCMEEDIGSLEQLYEKYGMPYEVANTYFAISDVDAITRKMRYRKWVKITVSVMLFLVFCGVLAWGITTHNIYQILEEEEQLFLRQSVH